MRETPAAGADAPSGPRGAATGADAPALVRLDAVTKRFPGVLAADAISLELKRGEIHCLLGENGAGKSTLIGMLAGLQQPDAGRIEIDGAPVVLRSPHVALAHGIGVVHQHSVLVPTMTVRENLMLGAGGSLWLDRQAAAARLAELGEVLGGAIDPEAPMSSLGFGQRQQLEIEMALRRGSRVLVLDEPTSMLPPQAVARLLDRVRGLADEGLAVLLVTHKLREALAIADAVTVLRRGRVTESLAAADLAGAGEAQAADRLLAAMFGSEARDAAAPAGPGGSPVGPGDAPFSGDPAPVLSVEHLSTRPGTGGTPVNDISFDVRRGEIVGIAGIDGHGQRHLAEAIAGQRPAAHGRILLAGTDTGAGPGPGAGDATDLTHLPVRERRRLGIRYVTDDRLHEGIVGSLSVAVNLVLKQIGERPFWRRGRMDRRAVDDRARRAIDEYGISAPSPATRAGTLSGGNIQKLLLARELADEPRAIVLDKPTYGLDLKTVDHVRASLRGFAAAGGAVLLISTDLDELTALCGRILVLSGGRLVGEVPNTGGRAAERVGELMVAGPA